MQVTFLMCNHLWQNVLVPASVCNPQPKMYPKTHKHSDKLDIFMVCLTKKHPPTGFCGIAIDRGGRNLCCRAYSHRCH